VTRERVFPLPPDLLGARAASSRGGILFTLACVAVAFWDLDGRSLLHRDVSRFAAIARDMLRTGDFLVPMRDGVVYANKPILYPWLVAAASWIFGDVTAFTVRLPSAVALVWMAHTTAAWGTFRSGSPGVGRIAGLLLLTTFFVLELGRVGRPDLLAAAFGTCASFRLDRACAGAGRRADPWVAGVALGAGMLTKGPPVLLLPLFVILVPRVGTSLRERLRRSRPLLLLLLALGIPALWFVPAALQAGSGFARHLLVDQVATRVVGEANHEEVPWFYAVVLPFEAAPWSPFLVAASLAFVSRRARALFGGGAHVGAAGATLLAFSAFPTKEIRYLAALIPPGCVALAQWVPALAYRLRSPRLLTWGLRLGGLLAVAAAGIGTWAIARRVPTAIPWVAPAALLLLLAGLGALASPASERSTLPVVGRIVGLAVLAAAT
jgi:4-amino-4-deoxy-L-arabinose transferase-like glycosyltransferase